MSMSEKDRRMKGAKDEERLMSPLFLRLPLNNGEKRGSRVPPRNKIALYEQPCKPCQRSSSGTLPFLPLPSPDKDITLVSSISCTHAENSDKSMLWQHCNSPRSSTWVDQKHHSLDASNGIRVNTIEGTHEHKPLQSTDCSYLDAQKPMPSILKPLHPQNFSKFKNFEFRGIGHQHCNTSQQYKDRQSNSEVEDLKPSLNLQIVHEKQKEGVEFLNHELRHSLKSKLQNEQRNQEYINKLKEKMGFSDNKLEETRKKNIAFGVKNASWQRLSLGSDCAEMMYRSLQAKDISPKDVIEVLGEKQFWEVRRSIVNQQKLFTVQVFELHRLVKVQKLVAESPNILLEDSHSGGKPSVEVSTMQQLLPNQTSLTPFIHEAKDDHSQKPNTPCIEFVDETTVLQLPSPCLNNGTGKGLIDKHPKHTRYSTATSRPLDINLGTPSWCFPLSGNQWLIPVMSPSEGLVYKLCATTFGVPTGSHQQGFGIRLGNNPSLGQTNDFPNCGIPIQGRPTSSSFERARGDVLPLFPMEPISAQNFETSEHQTQVIKVLPHNPKLATTSAAQIVQSIQKEKKQHD